MAVPFSNTKLRVPKGFQNILEGLSREILRHQPENAFEFGCKYFEQLLKVREGKFYHILVFFSFFSFQKGTQLLL